MLKPSAGRAALYVRASTEHQNYSTDHQEAALQEYAAAHDFQVERVYKDNGRSGLTLHGRSGLLQLLTDIQSDDAKFDVVLVYDVSRWVASRTSTRAPTTSTPVVARESLSRTARSHSLMMGRHSLPC